MDDTLPAQTPYAVKSSFYLCLDLGGPSRGLHMGLPALLHFLHTCRKSLAVVVAFTCTFIHPSFYTSLPNSIHFENMHTETFLEIPGHVSRVTALLAFSLSSPSQREAFLPVSSCEDRNEERREIVAAPTCRFDFMAWRQAFMPTTPQWSCLKEPKAGPGRQLGFSRKKRALH